MSEVIDYVYIQLQMEMEIMAVHGNGRNIMVQKEVAVKDEALCFLGRCNIIS